MLSEHVIPLLLRYPFLWMSSFVAYVLAAVWLGWHWWFQYRKKP